MDQLWFACATCEILSIDFNQLQSNYGQDIFQTGHQQEYDLNVSGGSEGVRYFAGGSRWREHGDRAEQPVEIRLNARR